MVLEHYKTELELAQYVSKLEAQVEGYKALCERLQAQADEMRSGRGCRCTMRQKLVGDGCSVCNPEYAADHIPDTTKMVESQWISVEDRLPEPFTVVALMHDDRWMNTGAGDFQANWTAAGWLDDSFGRPHWSVIGEMRAQCLDAATHWMPLPASPTTSGDGQHE